jgi:hypothetical protein
MSSGFYLFNKLINKKKIVKEQPNRIILEIIEK